jgi:ferredoxin
MKIMKTIAVYFSPTHTTEKSLKAFSEGTGVPFEMIDLTTPAQRTAFKRTFRPDELLVVGFPVYGGRLPKGLDNFFTGIQGQGGPAVATVVYGNRDYDDSLLELKMKLDDCGFQVRAAATFIGEHTFSAKIASGRPNDTDLATASEFGKKVALALKSDSAGQLNIKGTFPFNAKGTGPGIPPTTSEDCVMCGLCSANCPWGAIDTVDNKTIDTSKCMRCARCVKDCPTGAKQFTNPEHLAFVPKFEKMLAGRRCEPELFLPV